MRGAVGSQLQFFSFFLLLGLIAFGVVGALYLQFGRDLDVRELASASLALRMEDCVRSGITTFAGCGFVTKTLEQDYWIGRVCMGDCFVSRDPLDGFGGNLEACRLSGGKQNLDYPRCVERTFSVQGVAYHVVVGTNYRGGDHA